MEATPSTSLGPEARGLLLRTASAAIEAALTHAAAVEPALEGMPHELTLERATFVTLTVGPVLRGCCGTLEARRPLARDVWHNARASAFQDPRFPPLTQREWAGVDIEISVLSALTPVEATSEAALVRQLVPGEDGLVIAWRGRRATFLPKVWRQIEDPEEFVASLKRKAGCPERFWATDVGAWRYRTEQVTFVAP